MSQRWLLAVVVVALVAGCQKSSKKERREAEAASVKVEQTGIVVLQELEHGDAKAIDRALRVHIEAIKDAEEEQDEALAAAARERASYKQLLEKEIGWIDQRVAELENETARAAPKARETKAHDLGAAKAYRLLLKHDLEEIERTGEPVWPPLKERIDHDLEDERPASVPHGFEKSYGI